MSSTPLLIIDHSAPVKKRSWLRLWPFILTLTFDPDIDVWLSLEASWRPSKWDVKTWWPVDLSPMTLTYNPSIDKVKVDPHAKDQGQMVQAGEHRQMDRQMKATKCIIFLASWLIKNTNYYLLFLFIYWSFFHLLINVRNHAFYRRRVSPQIDFDSPFMNLHRETVSCYRHKVGWSLGGYCVLQQIKSGALRGGTCLIHYNILSHQRYLFWNMF